MQKILVNPTPMVTPTEEIVTVVLSTHADFLLRFLSPVLKTMVGGAAGKKSGQ